MLISAGPHAAHARDAAARKFDTSTVQISRDSESCPQQSSPFVSLQTGRLHRLVRVLRRQRARLRVWRATQLGRLDVHLDDDCGATLTFHLQLLRQTLGAPRLGPKNPVSVIQELRSFGQDEFNA